MNPYQVLKVRKNASKATIRRAYRKRALETHPDRGGNREEFEQVQFAYQILSDDARRARYDATGETDEPKPVNNLGQIMGIIRTAYLQTVTLVTKTGQKMHEVDVLVNVCAHVIETRKQYQEQLAKLEEFRETIVVLVGRFEVDGGANLLDNMVRDDLRQCEKNMERVRAEIDLHGQALELLQRYRFRYDQKVRPARKTEYGYASWTICRK